MILLQTWGFSITICWVTRRYRLNNHSYIPSINGTIPTRTYPPLVRCGRPVCSLGNPGEMLHGAMVSDIRRRTTPIFFDFQICSPGMFPPKIGDHIATGYHLWIFNMGTYLASGIASFHHFSKLFYQIKESEVLGPGDSRPAFFLSDTKQKNIDGSLDHFTCFIWGIQN